MTKAQIGKVFKKARKEKGMTHYMVGKLTKSDPDQIISIEEASKNYTIDLLLKVADVLEIKIIAE